jgi:chemotaxis protein methyltransferase CheR
VTALATPEIERFRELIARRFGLQFEDSKRGFLGEVLARRRAALKLDGGAYLRRLETQPAADELAALARELVVTETYFFRNRDQFRALVELVLPERMAAHAGPLRFLSAGCATGEEAYSLAIAIREAIADPGRQFSVRAVDVNPAALKLAARARYSEWAFRETPPELRARWFRAEGREFALIEAAREPVTFEAGNLAEPDPGLWPPQAYDAVFCRNVIMYFAPEQARALLARIARSLAPGGFLFLGHAETPRGLSDDFLLRHSHDTFYYQRADGIGLPVLPSATSNRPAAIAAWSDDSWADVIVAASARVEALAVSHEPALALAPPSAGWDRVLALDLLRRERFGEALDLVRNVAAHWTQDPDRLLLEGVLLAHGGRLAAAEETCRRLLAIDDLNAGAHYVLALCREHAGDGDGAVDHDRMAAYLDPAFAMPRLHLGLLARRAGDGEAARHELRQALLLLKREAEARLVLFGGGFTREALIALAGAELRQSGGEA